MNDSQSQAPFMHILLVDDDPDLLLLTKRLLEAHYHVTTAASGYDCMQAISHERPDMCLLDVTLPDISGVEICQNIKGDPVLSSIYVLLYSGIKTGSESIIDGLDTGADEYLLKPLKNRELLARVDAASRIIKAEKSLRKLVARTDAILGSVPDIIMESDHNLVYTWANQAGYDFFGNDVIGKEVYDFLTEQHQANSHLENLIDDRKEISGIENWQRRKDGEKRLLSWHSRLLKDEAGNISGVLSTARDITLAKQSDIALQQSEEKYRMIAENTSDGIVLFGSDSTIQYVSPAYLKQLGYTEAEELSRTPEDLYSLIHHEDRDLLYAELYKSIENKQIALTYSYRILHRDGYFIWREDNAKFNYDESGNYLGAAVICRDISARRHSEIYQKLNLEIQQILNGPGEMQILIPQVLQAVIHHTKIDAVGLRLRKGEDFPYYAYAGFSDGFILSENSLIACNPDGQKNLDENGDAILECTCGLVIAGITKPENSLLTAGGSVWTNDSVPFLNLAPEKDPRIHPRNRCIHEGFSSMALIPVRISSSIIGLLQLNNNHKGFFTAAIIERIEEIALHIGEALGRKNAEEAMKVSEEKYRTTLNASPDGILLIDMKGIITEVSEIGLELFGTDTRADLVGNDIHHFVLAEDSDTLKETIEKALNEGIAQNVELKIRKRNLSVFTAETSTTLIQSQDGAPLSFMIIIRDISHRKKMETNQAHADRMANLGEMASGIAHEINQPLNIISMVMDKILFEVDKNEIVDVEFLKIKSNKIFENITRIRNIIDHIRAFSKSHDDYILTAFDINLSIENAVSMLSEQFKHLEIS